MSSFLKESMADEFAAVAEREGIPDLIDRIADERNATTVDDSLSNSASVLSHKRKQGCACLARQQLHRPRVAVHVELPIVATTDAGSVDCLSHAR